MRVLVALVAASCGGKKEAPPHDPPLPSGSASVITTPTATPEAPPATPPEFPEGTRSLELLRTVGVRIEPGDGAKRIGTIEVDHGDTDCKTPNAAASIEKNWAHSKEKGFESPAAHERSRESMRTRC